MLYPYGEREMWMTLGRLLKNTEVVALFVVVQDYRAVNDAPHFVQRAC